MTSANTPNHPNHSGKKKSLSSPVGFGLESYLKDAIKVDDE